jgi:ABC-type nickel/cobalt efflux system permease component RcnA
MGRFSPILICLIGLVVTLACPPAVQAHPLDEFYQATFVTVAPNRVSMIVELYTGVLVAPQVLAMVDANHDELISEAEQQAYVDQFLRDIIFEVDNLPRPLTATTFEFPSVLDLKAGVGVIRFTLSADLPPDHRGDHQFFYQNNHQPEISVYLVNALSDDPQWVQIKHQERDILQASLRLDYTVSPDAPVSYGADQALTEIEVPGGVSEGQKQLTSYLYDTELSPFLMLVVVGLSTFLGGLHALTPGHGKTLVAAYLIGSRGTVKHAVFLGGVVTFTHTASVIGLGLLALLASQLLVPNILVPALEILSGLLVVFLGAQLIWTRWRVYRQGEAAHHHLHPHPHNHTHEDHSHDDQPHHDHHHSIPEQVKLGDLLALGISGGLIPCPEALGIMLIAIGLNRILLGLGMVVAFSFGLAAVLIIIGILLVRMKSLLDSADRLGSRWQRVLPLISAVIVTLLGVGIVIKGLMPYLS